MFYSVDNKKAKKSKNIKVNYYYFIFYFWNEEKCTILKIVKYVISRIFIMLNNILSYTMYIE